MRLDLLQEKADAKRKEAGLKGCPERYHPTGHRRTYPPNALSQPCNVSGERVFGLVLFLRFFSPEE